MYNITILIKIFIVVVYYYHDRSFYGDRSMRGSLWVELAVFLSVSFGGMFVIAFFLRRLGGFKRVVIDGRVVSFPASPYVAALISLAMFIPALAALAVSMVSGENFFDYGLRRLGDRLTLVMVFL